MELDTRIYDDVKAILHAARNSVYQVANSIMVKSYFEIGRMIVEKQNGSEKAEYGTELLKKFSKELTAEFGKGFTIANLKNMSQLYLTFQKGYALSSELGWTHYRLLMSE